MGEGHRLLPHGSGEGLYLVKGLLAPFLLTGQLSEVQQVDEGHGIGRGHSAIVKLYGYHDSQTFKASTSV